MVNICIKVYMLLSNVIGVRSSDQLLEMAGQRLLGQLVS